MNHKVVLQNHLLGINNGCISCESIKKNPQRTKTQKN